MSKEIYRGLEFRHIKEKSLHLFASAIFRREVELFSCQARLAPFLFYCNVRINHCFHAYVLVRLLTWNFLGESDRLLKLFLLPFKTSILSRSISSSIFLLCISMAYLSCDKAIGIAFKVAISSLRPIRHCAKEMLLFPGNELPLLELFDVLIEIERGELLSRSSSSKSLILTCIIFSRSLVLPDSDQVFLFRPRFSCLF